jgi:non-specific serine/threonine protein kinase
MADVLVDALAPQELLLVIDNCEHVVGACAKLADALLRTGPKVHILATSREPLGVDGERVYRVPSMRLPPEDVDNTAELLRYDAVRLFSDRAERHQPSFAIDGSNATRVAALCRRLDGMPLAIELAASRLRTMTLAQIQARLDERFRLLIGSTRTAPARQQTLRATVDWSYELLIVSERWALRTLSVFVGGFDLEAAETVCAGELGPWDVADAVSSLVDKSLLQAEAAGEVVRFSMLETIRDYAAGRLSEEAGDAEGAARRGHAAYFLDLAEIAAGHVRGPGQVEWTARLDRERANMRAALTHLVDEPGGGRDALRLGSALRYFWHSRAAEPEGAALLVAALARSDAAGRDGVRAKALAAAGALSSTDDVVRAASLLEEGLAIASEIGDQRVISDCAGELGWIAICRGDISVADAHLATCIEVAGRLGDHWLEAMGLDLRAICRRYQGDLVSAKADHAGAIARFRETGDQFGLGTSLLNLAMLELEERDLAAAREHMEEVHRLAVSANEESILSRLHINLGTLFLLEGDPRIAAEHYLKQLIAARRAGKSADVGYTILGLALCATAQQRPARAAALHGAADAIMSSLGLALDTLEAGMQQADIAILRTAMGDDFDSAYSEGRHLDVEGAVALARHEPWT